MRKRAGGRARLGEAAVTVVGGRRPRIPIVLEGDERTGRGAIDRKTGFPHRP